jgi:hypothetical protein
MRERPKTIQRLYEEFEKYCRPDNDFRMCMEEQSLQKLTNLARGNCPIPETPCTPTLGTFLALTVKMPRRIPIHRLTPKALSLARLVHHIRIKGAAADAEEAVAGAEVEAGAQAIMRKENGTASSIRRMTTIARITVLKKRFEAILEEERKEKERASTVNHSAPAWQNPSFGRNSFANPFQPPQFQPPPSTYFHPPPWQSQTFQA